MDAQQRNPRIVTPVPDPTSLTTEQLRREILSLKELVDVQFASIDKATVIQFNSYTVELMRLRELHEEMFRSIEKQFKERDVRSEQSARDSKVAVDAALQAAKEAVGEQNKSSALAIAKSETATMKQIDQIGTLIDTMRKGLDIRIDDIKERLTSLEGQKRGLTEERGHVQAQQNWGIGIAVSIGLGVLGLIVAGVSLAIRLSR